MMKMTLKVQILVELLAGGMLDAVVGLVLCKVGVAVTGKF